jgi:plasmid stabilization system protein ParE
MSWRVVLRPETESDIAEAAGWYEARREGVEFREAVIHVLDALADNPLLNSRQHPRKNIRWRYTRRVPYRVIYEVIEPESLVVAAAVLPPRDMHGTGKSGYERQ